MPSIPQIYLFRRWILAVQTKLPDAFLATRRGARAEEILRSCVHCGFCNATCPTYQLSGDELDGPRGRIYLIKELFEEQANEVRATVHLDRCLTCRACETTCPSGVSYGELAELARDELGAHRGGSNGIVRRLLQWLVPHAARLRTILRLGRLVKPLLPQTLAKTLPKRISPARDWYAQQQATQRVLLLQGCAQQVMTGEVNEHLQKLLAAREVGVTTLREEQCCGSLKLHLGNESGALASIRHNVDAFYPLLADYAAIVSSASGCGVTVKDYGRLLAHDQDYAERAAAVAAHTVDVGEFLAAQDWSFTAAVEERRIAWQAPCTLQHGQGADGKVAELLVQAGYELVPVADEHLCCGSAGTYSILQPEWSQQLKANKLQALQAQNPDLIATANVGCQNHLETDAKVPVVHWVQLLA